MKGQVGSAAELIGKSVLSTCGRLRCEVRIAYQGVSPELDSPARGPANSRTTVTRNEPVVKVIHHAVIESIHVLRNMRQFIETEERITEVSLPCIGLKYACDVLR